MTPEQAAHDAREAIVRVPSGFMTDAATYARGAELEVRKKLIESGAVDVIVAGCD